MKVLILTTLDVLGRQNNREHHLIAHYASRASRLDVVFRARRPADADLGGMMRASAWQETRDGVTYHAVIPPLSPPDGAVRAQTAGTGRAPRLKALLGTAMDSAAVLRDRLAIRALAQAAQTVSNSETLILALGPWAALAGHRLKEAGQAAHVVYIDRDYEPGFTASILRRRHAIWAETQAAGRADLTLSIGHKLAARLAPAKVHISPTGVDADLFTPHPDRPPRPHFIHVGEVAPWAGLEEAIAALPQIPDARMTIIGPVSDGYRAHLSALAQTHGAEITITGKVPRPQVIAALDTGGIGFAVFRPTPLRQYAAPLKLLEYMAAGLPALAVEGSEAADTLTRAGAGLTCACTPPAIATAARALLDPAAYAKAAAAGPPFAAALSWEAVLTKEEALIRETLGIAP